MLALIDVNIMTIVKGTLVMHRMSKVQDKGVEDGWKAEYDVARIVSL